LAPIRKLFAPLVSLAEYWLATNIDIDKKTKVTEKP